MPIGTLSTAAANAVQSTYYEHAARLLVTLPGLGQLDLTGNMVGCSFQENDTSSYPDDLADVDGITTTAGSVELAGTAAIGGQAVSMLRLFNPDDSASPLYRQSAENAPLTLSLGANGELVTRVVAYVTTAVVDVAGGLVTLNFSDVPPGWDDLPAIPAVLTDPPWNAGLTPEFVMDRIARVASNGVVSSWPAERPNCRLAVGLRSSLWPEVGVLLGTLDQPSPTFAPGPYGTGLNGYLVDGGYSHPQYALATPITGSHIFMEFFVSGLTATSPLNGEFLSSSQLTSYNSIYLELTTSSIGVSVNNGDPWSQAVSIDGGVHYIGMHIALPAVGGTTATVTVWVDGASYTGTATLFSPRDSGAIDTATLAFGGAVYAGVQITTEANPAPNYPFTPLFVSDPSLSTLQAVPAIDAGTSAYDELQAVAEAEGGYIAFRSGVLTFLNRQTIASQSPSRTVTAATSLMGLQQAQTGSSTLYDDIALDYTLYNWAKPGLIYQPKAIWSLDAGQTQSWIRTLPDGLTVGQVDGDIPYLDFDTSTPGSLGVSRVRASLDRDGVNEIPNTSVVSGTVRAVTASQIEITLTNHGSRRIFFASPANYASVPAGTPSVWIAGVAVTPDDPTTIHVNNGTQTSTYQVPTNGYRQDCVATTAFGWWLLSLLSTPVVAYGSVDIVPDPRITCGDRVTLDVPVDAGETSLDVYVTGVSFTASFEQGQEAWDMSLDVRAVAAPGEWVLDESLLDDTTYIY